MNMLKKVFFRISRIVLGKKGIYCKVMGKNNKFGKMVFIEEVAKVGSYNYFGPFVMVNNAIVGNYCSIGPGVKIGQGHHSLSYYTTYQRISGELIGHSLKTEPAVIGNDVWCGANVVIMQGVKVGDGAVIGANAVVTKDIPDYAIAVGIPAKVINYRFNKEKIKMISESKWFNYDITEAKKILRSFD